ncbi:zinc-ribbon domain-containing protein [Neobacillus sp. 179-C4.2 HS]|uniref:Zinc-ribbon domain-containing protein n=1 Tax=Neobacillus driksii TaxID=3035913 RepID=A0ABV4YZ41_9BACI|nr:zinc-ribbon domain-containing protein [Neobacillus sp. 179.-C4.2 HS]MDP5194676.1 zinc-ribbon domain-containing protein [Neobacillus sp. 179.-C4.2 HS]
MNDSGTMFILYLNHPFAFVGAGWFPCILQLSSEKNMHLIHVQFPSELLIEFQATEKSGCPFCTNKIVCDDNNLAVTHPQIKEWHPKKNGALTPKDVTKGSDNRISWVCSEGHEWQTKVYNRTKINGTNCPKCSKMKKRSIQDSSSDENK